MSDHARCAALDSHGNQCRATANLTPCKYHGDSEIYSQSPWPWWVVVPLCPRHMEKVK
jgi:hypothetical protein